MSNISLHCQYTVKQTGDENQENHQLRDIVENKEIEGIKVGKQKEKKEDIVLMYHQILRSNFKGATSRMAQVRCSQSILIFSILDHPCPCLVYYDLFGVFLPQ